MNRQTPHLHLKFSDEEISPKLKLFRTAYWHWESTLESFNFKHHQLFQHIELVDPSRVEQSKDVIIWFPVSDFVVVKHQLQKGLDENHFTRTLSGLTRCKYSKGATITAPYLWEARQDPELTSAILLEASLFARMGSSRTTYPRENWPPGKEVRESREAIRHFIKERLQIFVGWPHLCTDVLPVSCEDDWYKIEETYALWRYLAEEHARLYSHYRVLRIDFVKRESKEYITNVQNQ